MGRLADLVRVDPDNWRAGLLSLVLRATFFLGIFVYFPSLYFALRDGLLGVAIIDTIAMIGIAGLLIIKPIPFKWRASIFCFTIYLVSVGLLLGVGPISQIYLFAFSVITALLLGLRAGLLSALLSSVTLLVTFFVDIQSPEMVLQRWDTDFPGWIAITLNFTFVNTMLTLATGAVIAAIDDALKREIAAGESLERERTLLRTLIDALPDIIVTKDTSGRYEMAIPAALALLGVNSEEELAGRTPFDVNPASLAETIRADDLEVLAGRPVLNREEFRLDGEGNSRCFLTIKVPLHNANQEIAGLIGISRDVTDHKQAQAERDRLLSQVQLQIERMPLAYLLTDGKLRYTRWNPAAERMFGFAESEVLGKHAFEVIVPLESQASVGAIFDKVKAGSMDADTVNANVRKDGSVITCEWHNTPLFDANGDFAGLLSLAQDITDRTKLEGQLRHSQKLEAIGQLAGGIAHDFNNLLTVITGYTAMSLRLTPETDQNRGRLEEIAKAAERSTALTRQLLAFSRKQVLAPRVLDLNFVVRETEKMLVRVIGEDVGLTTVLRPDLGSIKADPGQLEQVLVNLAVNARDAMPLGGKLTIETSRVELDEGYANSHRDVTGGRYVMLAVSDTGSGMTDEVKRHLFEPYFTTKEVGKGTGLGMAVVYGIVNQSGGRIEVYSEVNVGTTFKIYFPELRSERHFERTKKDVEGIEGGTETIFLVEDEESVRSLIRSTLEDAGYSVIEASSGEDAMRVVSELDTPFQLLITDVVMPGMGGRALSERMLANNPGLKVLFISGYTDDAVVRHGILHEQVNFLQKPFSPTALARKVRQILAE